MKRILKFLGGHIWYFLIFLAVVTALTPVVVYVTYEMAFRGKIYPGIQIDKAKGQGLKAKGVKIIYGEKTWEVKADQLGVNLDWDMTREKLYRTGRSGDFIVFGSRSG